MTNIIIAAMALIAIFYALFWLSLAEHNFDNIMAKNGLKQQFLEDYNKSIFDVALIEDNEGFTHEDIFE